MKDEIKEKIFNLRAYLGTEENWILTDIEDYITNLQDTLKDREEYCYGLETELTNLQEELKSANESITWWQNRFNAIQQENKNKISESLSYDLAVARVKELEDRIEKALDKLYCYGEIFDSKILQQFQKEMENILQGEDKDEVEILEEKKIPEKLSTWFSVEAKQSKELNIEYANTNFENMYEKINEIIDYLESKENE